MLRRLHGIRRTLDVTSQDLLLFKQVHVMGLHSQLDDLKISPQVRASAQFLLDRGFLVHAPGSGVEVCLAAMHVQASEAREGLAELQSTGDVSRLSRLSEAQLFVIAASAGNIRDNSELRLPTYRAGVDVKQQLPLGAEALVSLISGFEMPDPLVPIYRSRPSEADWRRLRERIWTAPASLADLLGTAPGVPWEGAVDGGSSSRSEVVELVLARLPIPADDVPLEDVLDFVADQGAQEKLRRLDLWIARASTEAAQRDIELEIDELLHDYENDMRVAGMRYTNSGLRVLLSTPFEVVEELLHLRPASAAKALVSFREAKADRLEAELAARGSSLAYIYDAQRRFGSI